MSHSRSLFLTFAVESRYGRARANSVFFIIHPEFLLPWARANWPATCLFIQTHELFPSEVIINRLGVLSLVPFCSQPYSASQPSAALLWMEKRASVAKKAARDFVVGAECVSYGLRNIEEPVFLLILASPSMNNLLRQLARSLRDRYTRHLAVHFSLRLENTIALLSASQMLRWALIYAHALHLHEPGNGKVLPIEWAAARNMKSSNRKIANENSEVSLPKKK